MVLLAKVVCVLTRMFHAGKKRKKARYFLPGSREGRERIACKIPIVATAETCPIRKRVALPKDLPMPTPMVDIIVALVGEQLRLLARVSICTVGNGT